MQLRNSKTNFGLIAQLLHWLMAFLIVGQIILARMASDAPLFERLELLARHKSLGMTILLLALVRLAWRLTNPLPSAPADRPRYQRILARSSHMLMYLLLFAMPATGWLMSSALNTPVGYFGLFTWPDLVAPDPDFGEQLIRVHGTLFLVLAVMVCLHTGAALYHHFVARDDVLRRMIPGLNR